MANLEGQDIELDGADDIEDNEDDTNWAAELAASFEKRTTQRLAKPKRFKRQRAED